ncbi:MAG: chemotaxis protein CheA [Prolixibacteraceae bacterium]
MNSFIEKFREEVSEYCERLESGLLILENDPVNYQVIDEIFRIMHSMKGSGGMFGFDLISEVTHDLESLYDIFRTKKHQPDSEVISFTLSSIDGLHKLMVQEPTEVHQSLARKMKSDTQNQISRFTAKVATAAVPENIQKTIPQTDDSNSSTYYISFVPDENIFANGTNPIYLIDELNALGECNIQISFDKLPDLAKIEPDKCYVAWYLFIATSEDVDTLNDVFIFVADSAEIFIEKIASGNVLRNEKILASYLNAHQNKEEWSIPEISVPEIQPNFEIQDNTEKEEDTVKLNLSPDLQQNAGFTPVTVDSIRVNSVKIDAYMNLVSELITTQSRLEVVAAKIKSAELEMISESFGKLSRQLKDNAFEMSLIPLQSVAVRFKRLIHDLSKSLNKEVELITEGMETEMDKNIIEKLMEPLLHIIRNSMDHGIESKETRLQKKKPEIGKISIKASIVGSFVQIDVEDDGAGLDLEKLKRKASEKGLLGIDHKLTDDEIYMLIFESGFSTSDLISDVSGRGVGMDVVRKRVQEMRGSIELTTEKDRFTRFTIKLPLSLSIIDGLLTTVGENFYVIPTVVIQNIHTVKPKLLKKEFRQVVELEGNQIPYINLHEEFYGDQKLPDEQLVVVVSYDNQLFGLIVDEVIREYQAVIKPLGRLLKQQDLFSGASILGTGELALVVDTNKMIKKYS